MSMTLAAESSPEKAVPHWVARSAFVILTVSLYATQAVLGLVLYRHGSLWLAVPLALLASHFMHGLIIGFHEASHGLLRQSRRLNEIDGVLLGIFSFMSFSLYRAAHQTHHMHLARERDEELWPFVHPSSPRWLRVTVAFFELFFGLFCTSALFLRSFLRDGSPVRSPKVRRRIWLELGLIVVVWTGILALVAWSQTWRYFLWLFFAPAWLAGCLQSWRKYIEHVGMAGDTPTSATRSIVSPGWLGRVVAFTLLHEPYHGVHHQHAGVTHAELPAYASGLEPKAPGELAPFPSYRHALWHLLRSLADPKVGPQWRS